jgi:glycosyltransferase involved in cell wall biosynthesis
VVAVETLPRKRRNTLALLLGAAAPVVRRSLWKLSLSEPLPFVSVIVPVFGHKELLCTCLRALEQQSYDGPREIIAVNNGRPGELDDLIREFPEVQFIEEPLPGSYNARNAGIARARGDILAFTDADCAPDPGWIANGIRSLLKGEWCGLVGGRVELTPSNPSRISAAELHDLLFGFPQKHYVHRRRYAATANMLTRRDVMEAVGPFCGDLLSGGDFEWGRRVASAGYALAYEEAAVVRHPARKYAEMIRKMRRTAAGERDRNPDWISCLRWSLRRLAPPVTRMKQILRPNETAMTVRQKLLVLGFATVFQWQTAIERIRLQLSGNASPRS